MKQIEGSIKSFEKEARELEGFVKVKNPWPNILLHNFFLSLEFYYLK